MAKEFWQRTKEIWEQKSDEELIIASENLSDFTEEAEEIIRAELRKRLISEPEPTVRIVSEEQSKQPINLAARGIIILVIGVALIIISPNLTFTETIHFNAGFGDMLDFRKNTKFENLAFFGGIALLIVGGIISAVGFSQFMSTQPTMPPAPATQPVVTQSVSPKSVELGNTPDEVQSVMGEPNKIINLGARVIHIYEDMKIIYDEGKVSDVQLT